MIVLNDNIDDVCLILRNINLKLDRIDRQVKDMVTIVPSFSEMGTFQPELKENYDYFCKTITNCISRLKRLNCIIKDGLLDDYDSVYRCFNTQCGEVLDDIMISFRNIGDNYNENSSMNNTNDDLPGLKEN